MRINCINGYFIFEESRAGEASDFVSLFGLELESKGNQFIFSDLADAPDFSIEGAPYLDTVATKTFAGKPWEIFEANKFVYNYDLGLLVPSESIDDIVTINPGGNFFVSDGLIMPGSLTDSGDEISGYRCWFTTDTMKFKYSEVSYVE